MNKEQNLKELEQESFREFNRDGLNETNFGIIFLLFFNAFTFGIIEYPSISPTLLTLLGLALIMFISVYIIFIFLYYKVYRKKYVYPRIGYVKPREVRSTKMKLGAIALMIIVIAEEIALIHMLSTGIVTIDWIYRWVPVFSGLTALPFCLSLKDRSGQNRYILVGILMIITGVALALAEFITTLLVPVIYFDGWGLAFIVMGIIKFVLFIRNYPIIDTPEVEYNER